MLLHCQATNLDKKLHGGVISSLKRMLEMIPSLTAWFRRAVEATPSHSFYLKRVFFLSHRHVFFSPRFYKELWFWGWRKSDNVFSLLSPCNQWVNCPTTAGSQVERHAVAWAQAVGCWDPQQHRGPEGFFLVIMQVVCQWQQQASVTQHMPQQR